MTATPNRAMRTSATFLIEFDDTQDNANHIHSVWRDFSGDFYRIQTPENSGAGRLRRLVRRTLLPAKS
jgi:hypothetical protein